MASSAFRGEASGLSSSTTTTLTTPVRRLDSAAPLLHPDRAHFHTDKIRPETLFFTDDISIEQTFYNSKGVLTTRQKDIADGQGVYTMTLTNKSDFIDPLTRYNPFFYDDNPGVRSLLDVHLQRVSREAMRRAMFTLILQAIPGGQ